MCEKSLFPRGRTGAVRCLVVTALACTGWACAGISTREQAQPPTVELTVRAAMEGAAIVEPRVASEKAGGAVITGVISTPNPCYRIEASIEGDGRVTILKLSAVSTGGFCVQTIAAFAYDASISGMTRGSHPIDVVYTYPNTGWEDRTFRVRISVP